MVYHFPILGVVHFHVKSIELEEDDDQIIHLSFAYMHTVAVQYFKLQVESHFFKFCQSECLFSHTGGKDGKESCVIQPLSMYGAEIFCRLLLKKLCSLPQLTLAGVFIWSH